MRISIKVDDAQVQRALGRFADQLPFATSLALNRLGGDIIKEAKADFPKQFTERTKWTSKGWRQKPATKRKLVTELSHKDAYMALQETGGRKSPKAGSKTVAVPEGARPTPQSTTPRSQWPGALVSSGKAFIIPTKSGEGLVVSRIGRTKTGKLKMGTKRQRSAPIFAGDAALRVMYFLKRSVEVKPRLGFVKRARQYVKQHWKRYAQDAATHAIKSARR